MRLLFPVAAAIAVAAIVLLVKLRSRPAIETPSPPATSSAEREPAPAPPPEIHQPRPAIPTRPRDQAVKPRVESAPPARVEGDAAEIVRQASNDYAHQRYREALGHAEKALAIDETSVLARSLAVLSACGLGRGDRALEHASALDERRRQPLLLRCHTEYGLELEQP